MTQIQFFHFHHVLLHIYGTLKIMPYTPLRHTYQDDNILGLWQCLCYRQSIHSFIPWDYLIIQLLHEILVLLLYLKNWLECSCNGWNYVNPFSKYPDTIRQIVRHLSKPLFTHHALMPFQRTYLDFKVCSHLWAPNTGSNTGAATQAAENEDHRYSHEQWE